MRKTMILIGMVASSTAWASGHTVTVCLAVQNQDVNYTIQVLAQGYASRIYHSIGIDLRWSRSCPKGALTAGFKTVGIEWAGKAPLRLQPGAWASARPFQRTGNRITLYLDRLADVLAIGPSAAAVLGHVLAHEIGHVLLGHNGHSSEGLMKARWSQADQSTMAHRLMEFTADEQEQLLRRFDGCR